MTTNERQKITLSRDFPITLPPHTLSQTHTRPRSGISIPQLLHEGVTAPQQHSLPASFAPFAKRGSACIVREFPGEGRARRRRRGFPGFARRPPARNIRARAQEGSRGRRGRDELTNLLLLLLLFRLRNREFKKRVIALGDLSSHTHTSRPIYRSPGARNDLEG